MTPLRIEAAYERILHGPDREGLRWGFRAVYERTDEAPRSPDVAEPAFQADGRRPSRARPVERVARPVRRGPREAEPEATPDPGLLRYTRRGRAVPLLPAAFDLAGRGTRLDLLA